MDSETLQRWLEEVPFHQHFGPMTIRIIESGVEVTAHGGVAATLLDTSLAFALIAATGSDWTTVDLRVDYLRPLGLGTVTARGSVVHAGRRIGRTEGELRDASGTVCARAIGTFATPG